MAMQMLYWSVFKDQYVQRMETYRPGSLYNDNVRRVLDRFTEYRCLAAKLLDEIQQTDLEYYLARRRQDRWRGLPINNVTLNNEIAILNSALAYAGPPGHKKNERSRLDLLERPPQLAYLQEDDLAPVELTPKQIADCLNATRYAKSPRIEGCSPSTFWVCALFLCSLTLLRRAALLQVPRPEDEILLGQKRLFLPAHLNKTRRDHYHALGSRDDIVQLFAALPSKVGEPLLPWRHRNGRPLSLTHFNTTLREFQIKAGIPKSYRVRTKDIRSTAATIVGDQFSGDVAKRKLGHSANTHTYEKHYKGRKPSPQEVAATDALADMMLESLRRPAESTAVLKIRG